MAWVDEAVAKKVLVGGSMRVAQICLIKIKGSEEANEGIDDEPFGGAGGISGAVMMETHAPLRSENSESAVQTAAAMQQIAAMEEREKRMKAEADALKESQAAEAKKKADATLKQIKDDREANNTSTDADKPVSAGVAEDEAERTDGIHGGDGADGGDAQADGDGAQ